jgi:hypothetical protein
MYGTFSEFHIEGCFMHKDLVAVFEASPRDTLGSKLDTQKGLFSAEYLLHSDDTRVELGEYFQTNGSRFETSDCSHKFDLPVMFNRLRCTLILTG